MLVLESTAPQLQAEVKLPQACSGVPNVRFHLGVMCQQECGLYMQKAKDYPKP